MKSIEARSVGLWSAAAAPPLSKRKLRFRTPRQRMKRVGLWSAAAQPPLSKRKLRFRAPSTTHALAPAKRRGRPAQRNRAREEPPALRDWPHSPLHRLSDGGVYMVTAATYHSQPLLHDARRLTLVRDLLLELAADLGWRLEAWAVLPNHYHFIAQSPAEAATLVSLVRRLHSATAVRLNAEDRTPGRRVWFQYWDSQITFERSYLARLKYVHLNAVKHGLVADAEKYPWCSAAWFVREAGWAFVQTVMSLPIDHLNVIDVECELPLMHGR